jgi:hypothetical protein
MREELLGGMPMLITLTGDKNDVYEVGETELFEFPRNPQGFSNKNFCPFEETPFVDNKNENLPVMGNDEYLQGAGSNILFLLAGAAVVYALFKSRVIS